MKISIKTIEDIKGSDNIRGILCFYNYCDSIGVLKNESLIDTLKLMHDAKIFVGNKGEVDKFSYVDDGVLNHTILIGLGDKNKFDNTTLRMGIAKIIKTAVNQNLECIDIYLLDKELDYNYDMIKAISETIIMTPYVFDKYKSCKKVNRLREVGIIFNSDPYNNIFNEAINEGKILGEGNLIARELVNEPSNNMTPEILASKAKEIGSLYNFEVEVFEKGNIEDLEMNAFLSVGSGSANNPKLIVMRYFGDAENKEDILGIVGKGITFDAGGYCLKTAGHMWEMKSDMGGAGALIGAMSAIARMKLKKNVIGVIAACENLISGDAYKPGDIIDTMNGKTIEIINTDAEGRLTLVDAMTYIIRKENAKKVIDIATLTGAVGGAIGNVATGVVDNSDEFYMQLNEASKKCDEKVWRFPTFEEYKELLYSGNADLVNSTGPVGAGAITAGLFIGEFVEEKPWIHLDIAAGAFTSKPKKEYLSKGATGVGTRLLYEIVKKLI